MKPQRIQLSRKKGWRMPENTVSVARPHKHGNPFAIGGRDADGSKISNRRDAVNALRLWLDILADPRCSRPNYLDDLAELRGKNLACWCPLDQPCHADVLLELANREAQP